MRFETLEVKAVREIDESECQVVENDDEADFFSLYGRHKGLAYCIGDFSTRENAEFIKSAIEK